MLDGPDAPADFRDRLEAWEVRSPVVKLNAALTRLPTFTRRAGGVRAAPGDGHDHAAASTRRRRRSRPASAASRAIGFAELYFQTAYDPGVAPEGSHTMSAFCQYAPYELAEGTGTRAATRSAGMILDAIAVHAPDVHECVEQFEVLGPPDIESRIGLTGGNIFQGEAHARPDVGAAAWTTGPRSRASTSAAPPPIPAGSVIALNGRNAAMAVLEDAGVPAPA